jgi:uncharacterized membrane protein (UPF0127 family)
MNIKNFTYLFLVFLQFKDAIALVNTQFNRDLKNYDKKVIITDANDKNLAQFSVAIADNEEKKQYGLMNLEYLPKEHGMLFVNDREGIITMWMKNTKIPLDMIFINKQGIIVDIKTDARPFSLDLISSQRKASKVLEINAGLVEELGIKTGNKAEIIP